MITDINNEDRLVQASFAEHLERALGWKNVYDWNVFSLIHKLPCG